MQFISRYPRTLTIFSFVPTLSFPTTWIQLTYIHVYLEPWHYSHSVQHWAFQPPKYSLYPDILESWQYSHPFQPWAFQPPEYSLYPDILEPRQYSHPFQPWAFQPPEYSLYPDIFRTVMIFSDTSHFEIFL